MPNKPYMWTFALNPAYQELENVIYNSIGSISHQARAILDTVGKIPPLDPEVLHLCNQSLQMWKDIVNSEEWQQMYKMQSLFAEQLKTSAWVDLPKQVIETTKSIYGPNLELYMDIQKQFSSNSVYDSIRFASELSQQIAENLQSACPLFSPAYIETASRLVAASGLSGEFEGTAIELPDIDNIPDEEEKRLKLAAF